MWKNILAWGGGVEGEGAVGFGQYAACLLLANRVAAKGRQAASACSTATVQL
jgi:hypothetical protein